MLCFLLSRSFVFLVAASCSSRDISGRLAEPTETTPNGSNANVKRGWPGEASVRRPAATPRAAPGAVAAAAVAAAAVAEAAVAEGAVAEVAATDSERCRPAVLSRRRAGSTCPVAGSVREIDVVRYLHLRQLTADNEMAGSSSEGKPKGRGKPSWHKV